MSPERLLRYLLDAGCILVGLGGIVHQTVVVPPGQASESVLVACVAVLGIPAGVAVATARPGPGASGTPLSGSGSPSPDGGLPPSSASPAASSGAGGEPP